MMRDYLGNELEVGDVISFAQVNLRTSIASLGFGQVVRAYDDSEGVEVYPFTFADDDRHDNRYFNFTQVLLHSREYRATPVTLLREMFQQREEQVS